MKKQSLLLLVGAFGCLFTAVYPLSAQTWTQTSAPTNAWSSVASSADGSKLVAAVNGGGIYTSTDSGATWTLTNAANASWTCVASSADGTKLAAVSAGFPNAGGWPAVQISTNSGATWDTRHVVTGIPVGSSGYWSAVNLSADGTKLVVAENSSTWSGIQFPGSIYTSTNSGATWNSGPSGYWSSVASSADGTKLVAAEFVLAGQGRGIYTSTDSGATWTATGPLYPYLAWTSIASSADGAKLVAAFGFGGIYTSTDSGATWAQATNGPSGALVASSADGSKLVASFGGGGIYTSTDSGATWAQTTNGPSGALVASSADGSKLVAAVSGGGIYTLQTTPAPVLNIIPSSDNLAFSWLVSSTNFVLQQSSDLCTANWTDVTNNTPTLNLTNLQNQVALPRPSGNAFYRLKTP